MAPRHAAGTSILPSKPDRPLKEQYSRVRGQGPGIWLSLNQMAELFEIGKYLISKHISHVFKEGELRPEATVSKLETVQREGKRSVERTIDITKGFAMARCLQDEYRFVIRVG